MVPNELPDFVACERLNSVEKERLFLPERQRQVAFLCRIAGAIAEIHALIPLGHGWRKDYHTMVVKHRACYLPLFPSPVVGQFEVKQRPPSLCWHPTCSESPRLPI